MMMAWTTKAEASACRPAPIARAMAEAMAPPMLELAICCISMMSGKTSDRPASASDPIWPTKCASTVAVTAISTTLTMRLGAARRSSVETIGPSRRRRVRAAGGFEADITVTDWAIEALPFVMALLPLQGLEQRLDGASWESRAAAWEPDAWPNTHFGSSQQSIISRACLKNSHAAGAPHSTDCCGQHSISVFYLS